MLKTTVLKPSISTRLWSRSETRLWSCTLFLGTCVLYASRIALPICAVAIGKEYGWNKTDSGTVLSCFFWGYAVTQLVAGAFADVRGGENILPYSTLAWVLLTYFTPQLIDFAYYANMPLMIMLLFRVATGVAQAFHVPSIASMVSQHLTSTDKGRVFGIILAGSHVGTVIAGLFGTLLLESYGWRSIFQVVGFASLMWYALLRYVIARTGHRIVSLADNDENEDLMATKEKKQITVTAVGSPVTGGFAAVPWGTLFRHPAFWAAGVAQYCGGNAYFTMFNWLPSFFHEAFPSAPGIVYNVVPPMAVVVTSMVAPVIASRILVKGYSVTFTRRLMECVSLVSMGLCLLAVVATNSFVPALTIFTLALAARGVHHGGVAVNPHDFAPNHTGAVFGIFNACGAITGFIGVYVAGHILEATNNQWSYVFVVTALQCFIGAVVYGTLGTGSKII